MKRIRVLVVAALAGLVAMSGCTPPGPEPTPTPTATRSAGTPTPGTGTSTPPVDPTPSSTESATPTVYPTVDQPPMPSRPRPSGAKDDEYNAETEIENKAVQVVEHYISDYHSMSYTQPYPGWDPQAVLEYTTGDLRVYHQQLADNVANNKPSLSEEIDWENAENLELERVAWVEHVWAVKVSPVHPNTFYVSFDWYSTEFRNDMHSGQINRGPFGETFTVVKSEDGNYYISSNQGDTEDQH